MAASSDREGTCLELRGAHPSHNPLTKKEVPILFAFCDQHRCDSQNNAAYYAKRLVVALVEQPTDDHIRYEQRRILSRDINDNQKRGRHRHEYV